MVGEMGQCQAVQGANQESRHLAKWDAPLSPTRFRCVGQKVLGMRVCDVVALSRLTVIEVLAGSIQGEFEKGEFVIWMRL